VTGRVAPGWHPDYDAPPGHQRFWDGERWTERRNDAPGVSEPVEARVRRYAPWVLAVVAGLVVVSAGVLVLSDDNPATSNAGSSPPPPASTPGPPASGGSAPAGQQALRTWQVGAAVDGSTLRLANGAEVRLAGVADSCGTVALARLVVGQRVTLTRRGPDKDADGRLLRYVERDGTDVGKRLIQRGWARASDEPNARRAMYRRVDARSPDVCS
jgi:hypothetical protein